MVKIKKSWKGSKCKEIVKIFYIKYTNNSVVSTLWLSVNERQQCEVVAVMMSIFLNVFVNVKLLKWVKLCIKKITVIIIIIIINLNIA